MASNENGFWNHGNGFNNGNEANNAQEVPESVRVTLMSSKGMLHSLWIPMKIDGKYGFTDRAEQEDLSFLYLEVLQGVLYAHCENSCYFQTTGGQQSGDVTLADQSLTVLFTRSLKFVLYVEAEREKSSVFYPYYVERNAEIRVGKADHCDIVYAHPKNFVSRVHATITWKGEQWRVQDGGYLGGNYVNSTNGVFLNGHAVQDSPANVGDTVYVMGLRLLLGQGFFSINSEIGNVRVQSPHVRRIRDRYDFTYGAPEGARFNDLLFNRKPRKKMPLNADPIVIDSPPMSMNGNKLPLLLRLGTPAVMGTNAIMMGNVFMALTSMVMPFLTQGYTEKDRKEYEALRTEKYHEYLSKKHLEIDRERDREYTALNFNYPPIADVLGFTRNMARLWERRNIDDDFLGVRVGTGSMPMLAEYEYTQEQFSLDPDPLENEMMMMAQNPPRLENVPIMTSLVKDYICGVSGPRRAALALVRSFVLQLSVMHSYDEVKIIFLAERKDLQHFPNIRFLPHMWDDERSTRFLATEPSDTYAITSFLEKELREDLEHDDKDLAKILQRRPYYVIIALSKRIYDSMEILKDVLKRNENCGVSILAALEDLPKECSKIFAITNSGEGTVQYLHDLEHPEEHFKLEEYAPSSATQCVRMLANTRLKTGSQAYLLPKMVTFLEMFGAGRIEHLNPLRRWKENNPTKSLAAEVGVTTDGSPFTLDLHEKAQGPHGLVAGMTGSGKSEFIITYILSMAVNYHPDEVAFILIDYKGGGLAGAFSDPDRGIHLPHLVGTITNLDGAAIQRSLMSIESELKRRQAIFNEAKSRNNAGTMDIYSYQKLYRAGKVDTPLPHLFIISDEFAELKQQEPEFMNQLISTARIGRSLGVHLILATQKPAGVVNDQILSNTKFRVCLRVQDKQDSMDMLKRPEAAELKDTGRFYLQVGYNEFFAMGQSAWCGADYTPEDRVIVNKDESVRFVDSAGQTIISAAPKVKRASSGLKQIVAIVQYLTELAQREGIEPKKLWLDPVPDHLDLAELNRSNADKEGIGVYIGVADDPERQSQYPLYLDVQSCRNLYLVGDSGSGKSVFLQSLLFGLAEKYTPEQVQFYTVDFSGRGLNVFGTLPHCGASLDDSDEGAFFRLMELAQEIVRERKALFTEAHVSTYEAYIEIAPLPLVLFVIDNFTGINSFNKGTTIFATMHEYMRDASSFGVKFIITSSHLNELSTKTKQELGTRYSLRLKDRFAYTDALGPRCTYMPADLPGRGLLEQDGRLLEYQTAQVSPELAEHERADFIRSHLLEIAERDKACKGAYRLPTVVENEEYASFCRDLPLMRLPLGYARKDGRKVSIPYKQLFSLSLYFGNPDGVRPVLENLLFAGRRDGAKFVVVRSLFGSKFGEDATGAFVSQNDIQTLDSTQDDSGTLVNALVKEIQDRKTYRNAFCSQNGLDPKSADAATRAWSMISTNTRPIIVLFERFLDFVKNVDPNMLRVYETLFKSCRGYNIYFVACFEPDDAAAMRADSLMSCFNTDQLVLLTGGQLHRQGIVMLDAKRKMQKDVNERYDEAVMMYRMEANDVVLPCGALQSSSRDVDDLPIF